SGKPTTAPPPATAARASHDATGCIDRAAISARAANRAPRLPDGRRRTRKLYDLAYEPEVPVKMREWIGPALASPDVVLDAQPPAQPHRCVVVDRPVRFGDGAYIEVVCPSA